MKRRIFMLLAVMLMVLGMSQVALASEQVYEGTGAFYYNMRTATDNRTDTFYANYVRLERTDNYDKLTFTDGVESHSIYIDKTNGFYVTDYDGVDYTYLGDIGWDVFDYCLTGGGTKISYGIDPEWFYIGMELTLEEVGEPTEPTVYQVSTGFTGTAVSDRGDYNLYIAGYFNKELTDGTHALVLSDITSQTVAVIAHNNANGVNRNMNQSTIEEMTVTVSGGVITEMTVRGRVQTDGGTLDRYTAIINP